MSAIRLVWVGRRGDLPWERLARAYAERVRRFAPFEEVRVRPEEGRESDPRRALRAEAQRIRRVMGPGDFVVALDQSGQERTTEEFATELEGWRASGRVVFLVGSDLGLDADLKAEARAVLSLSRLTLPHALARVLLLEQTYRALDLLAGGSYHRAPAQTLRYNARPRRRW